MVDQQRERHWSDPTDVTQHRVRRTDNVVILSVAEKLKNKTLAETRIEAIRQESYSHIAAELIDGELEIDGVRVEAKYGPFNDQAFLPIESLREVPAFMRHIQQRGLVKPLPEGETKLRLFLGLASAAKSHNQEMINLLISTFTKDEDRNTLDETIDDPTRDHLKNREHFTKTNLKDLASRFAMPKTH